MSARLLLVEDDQTLTRALTDNFGAEGLEVRVVTRGGEVLAALEEFRPAVVVLDIMLPERSGLDILREMRAGGDETPVLMLTAKGEVVDRVLGLEIGADDYLPKPFALQELLARVRALLRRGVAASASGVREVVLGEVRFDFEALMAEGPEGPLALSPHDILTLKVLAEHRGAVVRRMDLVEEVSGMNSMATPRTVDNHVVSLRRAIGDDPRHPRWLHTVRGEGYRLARE